MKHSEMRTEPLSNRKICNFDDKIKVISMFSYAPRHENLLENRGVPPRILSLVIISSNSHYILSTRKERHLGVHCVGAGCCPETIWTLRGEEISFTFTGN